MMATRGVSHMLARMPYHGCNYICPHVHDRIVLHKLIVIHLSKLFIGRTRSLNPGSHYDYAHLSLFGAGPECNDLSKLRLLPDRPGYNGPKRGPGTDPWKGLQLAGKHGKTFRKAIKLWGWILKHHPERKFLIV